MAIALHRLASSNSDIAIGSLFGVSGATVYRATERFVEVVLNSKCGTQIRWPGVSEKLVIKRKFEGIAGFPNCVGAIDCTHILIEKPANSIPIDWRDRSHNYSMVIQAIVSPTLQILDVCTGWPGSVHDQRIFYRSSFHDDIEERLGGPDLELSVGNNVFRVPEHIVGDAGYMQQVRVMTPYSQCHMNVPKVKVFNEAHSATRMCVERAFGRIKNQWHYLDSKMCDFFVPLDLILWFFFQEK
jgi:DDE superfamily endonuclease